MRSPIRPVSRALAAIAVALALVASAQSARAQGASRFGDAHQVAISADFSLSMQGYSESRGGSSSALVLAPALDYFVVEHLSVGGQVTFSIDSASQTTFAVAPRVGYDIRINDAITFWPDAFVAFSTSSGQDGGPSTNIFSIGVFAPLLWHPAAHFFIGLGPDLSTELSHDPGDDRLTTYGIRSTLGGWF